MEERSLTPFSRSLERFVNCFESTWCCFAYCFRRQYDCSSLRPWQQFITVRVDAIKHGFVQGHQTNRTCGLLSQEWHNGRSTTCIPSSSSGDCDNFNCAWILTRSELISRVAFPSCASRVLSFPINNTFFCEVITPFVASCGPLKNRGPSKTLFAILSSNSKVCPLAFMFSPLSCLNPVHHSASPGRLEVLQELRITHTSESMAGSLFAILAHSKKIDLPHDSDHTHPDVIDLWSRFSLGLQVRKCSLEYPPAPGGTEVGWLC